ncbi:uncharacterized protein Z520_10190 [Fonsecaea multimorphosa CBS 102226]|uniref:Uncharacterized protein n=1 Tax=Fonsecaea multimorphosa CBS 102226 TaxID=1442371 RepID=A0A0D2JUH6_9EURO|nr:uncharacterized protein Z520_10190 [Fonsecaea multimorphosa CBS 102226]KIX94164.1 hypothetical protein Z520_10190 [Fonsecaea multimorphosa CBS 102226]OAL19517.1 hypothetical protein AYO22_09679 [Fonsecaea multimorphosa]
MPPNKKKKNRRNKVATQNQTQSIHHPKTVSCPRCNEEIVVPKTCKHGKKLINCQGTGCTTAHLDEHNADCRPITPSKPANMPPGIPRRTSRRAPGVIVPPSTPVALDPSVLTAQSPLDSMWANGPSNIPVSDRFPALSSTYTLAVEELSKQLATLKTRRGKQPRYVQGIPIDEWFQGLEEGSAQEVNEWTEKLKDLVEGKKTAEEIGYDDEDSDDEGDGCATPSEDE